MLNVLRQNFKEGPALRVVLLLVAVGLVAYLGSYFACEGGRTAGGDWAARVNGVEISLRQFRDTARTVDEYYRQMFGQNYGQIRSTLQIGQQAIQQLIDQELILQDARRLGLTSSRAELAEQIRGNPGFLDENGQFIGSERYRQIVNRGVPGGVAAFERALADGILAQRWANLVSQPVEVSEAELREAFRQRTEKTAVSYFVLDAEDPTGDEQVDPDALREWFDGHREDYRRGEARRIRFVVVDRQAEQAKVEISDEEIRSHYESNQDSFAHPEQRRARHILFRVEPKATDEERAATRARAEAALERLRQGADFGALARELSDDPGTAERGGDLGFFGRGAMVAAFEEAAFATDVGKLAPVTESPFGFHVIEVTDSRGAGVVPLDEARESIRRTLAVRAAQARVDSESERLHRELADGRSLDEVAAAEGLEIQQRTVTRDDRLTDLGASADMLSAIAILHPGQVSRPLQVAAGMALVTVDEVVPPEVPPLEDVREAVTADLLAERARQAALARARRALERNPDLTRAAAAVGQELRESGPLSPGQTPAGTAGSTPDLERALFGDEATQGQRGVVAVPAGALVYEITEREPFDPARFDSEKAGLRRELLTQKRGQYQQTIVGRLRTEQRIEVNHQLLARFGS